MSTVLAVTTSDDDTTELASALQSRGARLVRLASDDFPSAVRLDAEPTTAGYHGTLTTADGERVDLQSLRSIWMGRLATGRKIASEGLDRRTVSACRLEASATLEGLLAGLAAPQVNELDTMLRSERKPLQLVLAARAGLAIPQTRLGNDANGLRTFASKCPSITKMVSTPVLSDGRVGVPTSRVPDDLSDLDRSLRLAPTLFQEHVDKDLDIRAIVVADTVLAAGVDARETDGAQVDWREGSSTLMARFRPVEVPATVREGLLRLHRELGLVYGAADFVRRTDGTWVFLETNAAGRWAWLQAIGLDVAGLLADALLSAPPRWET